MLQAVISQDYKREVTELASEMAGGAKAGQEKHLEVTGRL